MDRVTQDVTSIKKYNYSTISSSHGSMQKISVPNICGNTSTQIRLKLESLLSMTAHLFTLLISKLTYTH